MSSSFLNKYEKPWHSSENPRMHCRDWHNTRTLHHEFQEAMLDRLAEAQQKGKGYFLEEDRWTLEHAMHKALGEQDYVSVANYAMMLHSIDKLALEKEEWENYEPE